jgi:hypothetical protein
VKLSELEPQFLKIESPKIRKHVATPAEADGVSFVCPKCLHNNGMKRPGVHSIICWKPNVPLKVSPGPGRWDMTGTSYADLSLVAGSSSVLVRKEEGGCGAHFFITNGQIIQAEPF